MPEHVSLPQPDLELKRLDHFLGSWIVERRLTFYPDRRFTVAGHEIQSGRESAMTLVRQRTEPGGAAQQQTTTGAGRRRIPRPVGAAVLVVLAAVIVGAHASRTPPPPRPASSQADHFSADRAFTHVEQIAAVPHPVGSAANAQVRDYLLTALRDPYSPRCWPPQPCGVMNWLGWRTSTRGSPVGRAAVMLCWPRITTRLLRHQAPAMTLPGSPRSWKRRGRCSPPPRCATTSTW